MGHTCTLALFMTLQLMENTGYTLSMAIVQLLSFDTSCCRELMVMTVKMWYMGQGHLGWFWLPFHIHQF